MRITTQALNAFNSRREVTFNDAYNVVNRLGTKAESDALHRVASAEWGICRDGQSLTKAAVIRAGHTVTAGSKS